ncbi:MAG: HAMP domain-containing sensor histidine kinase [Planctomycetota bacterium]
MSTNASHVLSERDVQTEISDRTSLLMEDINFRNCCKIDSGFFWLLFAQWVLAGVLTMIVTPTTWIGATEHVHMHVWFGIIFGALVSGFPMFMILKCPGHLQTRLSVGIAQAVWTCLLIHLTGGRIETHFHAFASLAFLAAYRDWRVLILATAVIGIDHFVRGLLWPMSVYGVAVDSQYRFLEHVAWVLFMDIFLFWSCFRHQKEAFEKYHRRAVLEEQAKLNEQMIKFSREAGKAEIATGVLHNVGNVMNSVNVSADVLKDRMRSKVQRRLQATHSLLEEHQQNLPGFFSDQQRAEYFVPFIGQLSEDVGDLLAEVESLQEKLNHVNNVVASQQDLATMSGVDSTFDMAEVIESSIVMLSDSFLKSRVEIDFEKEIVPFVTTDKHKLIQILVNLLRNAKHAIEDNDGTERSILVRLYKVSECRIGIEVRDTGVGISDENLGKIFQHGFSTRKDRGGHGFGLHHTVCVLQELGGELRADSEGVGRGATFFLELPVENRVPEGSA